MLCLGKQTTYVHINIWKSLLGVHTNRLWMYHERSYFWYLHLEAKDRTLHLWYNTGITSEALIYIHTSHDRMYCKTIYDVISILNPAVPRRFWILILCDLWNQISYIVMHTFRRFLFMLAGWCGVVSQLDWEFCMFSTEASAATVMTFFLFGVILQKSLYSRKLIMFFRPFNVCSNDKDAKCQSRNGRRKKTEWLKGPKKFKFLKKSWFFLKEIKIFTPAL
jgi:hypothetical protein